MEKMKKRCGEEQNRNTRREFHLENHIEIDRLHSNSYTLLPFIGDIYSFERYIREHKFSVFFSSSIIKEQIK